MFFPFTKDRKFVGYKAKLLDPKKFWCIPSIKGADLFGWEQAVASGSRKLFITEGEPDTIALYQALKDNARGGRWEHLEPAVVSLTSGAASAFRELSELSTRIRQHFQEVVIVFDNDEAGRKAAEEAAKALPWAQVAVYPGKDPNDAIINGHVKGLVNGVLFKANIKKNTRLVSASSLFLAGREQAKLGLSWPWPKMTELTRGIRFGETIYLGAGVKMGKSEVVNSLIKHFAIDHNLPVFAAKPEEANRKTVQLVAGKVAGRIFHDPEVPFDFEAYDRATDLIGDKLTLLSLYQHLGWETLRTDILDAIRNNGCKAIFIDPITNLTNGHAAGEANTELQEIAQELAAIALDNEVVIFIFCHLKAPLAGDPHERGGKVFSHQFAGSRAMMRSCNLMIGIEGNKDPDLPEDLRNMRDLVILEDREFGASGRCKLFWDKNTGLFNQVMEE